MDRAVAPGAFFIPAWAGTLAAESSGPAAQRVPADRGRDLVAARRSPRSDSGTEGRPRLSHRLRPQTRLRVPPGGACRLAPRPRRKRRRIKRGLVRSVAVLQAAINRFLEEHNQQ